MLKVHAYISAPRRELDPLATFFNILHATTPLALTLLLRIPDLPRFDPVTPAGWTLLDNANAALRSGDGPLASMPHADRVIAVAPVGHLLFIETALPPVAPAKRNALLRYAIEDKLTIDPSTVHAVVLGKSDTTQHVIAAIDRTWLMQVLQWLKQAGLTPDSLVSSASGIPVAAGEWTVVLEGSHCYAKRSDGFVYNLDIGAGREPPFGLTLALKEAREHQRAPGTLVLQCSPPDAALAAQWQATLQIPVRPNTSSPQNSPLLLAAAKSNNLLTGEFAPREATSKWLDLLKPALAVVVLMISAHIVFTLVDNWRLNRERVALEQQMTQVFKTAFPAAQAIVDPPLQMQRNLQQLKRERGMPAESDAQMQIARVASLLRNLPGAMPAISALTVRDGVATLDAVLASADQRADLQRAVDRLPGAVLTNMASGDAKESPLAIRVTLRAGA